MTVFTRIVAAVALVSFVFADIAGASAAENYAVAAHRARAHQAREPLAKAASGRIRRRRGVQKRCKGDTTTTTSISTTTPTTPKNDYTPTTKQTSTTTTTSQKPAETSTKPSSGGGKKGIAWGADTKYLSNVVNGNVKYLYNWQAAPPKLSGVKSASMLWGNDQSKIQAFLKSRDDYDYIMGPNEFNLGAQAGMSVSEVVSLWNQYIRPEGQKGKYLISPSVTTAPTGIDELQKFFDTCGGNDNCGCDAISLHYYGTKPAGLQEYVTKMHDTFKLDVWLSEFACQGFDGSGDCSQAQATTFLKETLAFAEQTSWIVMYSAYGFQTDLGNVNNVNAMIDSNGQVTALGRYYLDTVY